MFGSFKTWLDQLGHKREGEAAAEGGTTGESTPFALAGPSTSAGPSATTAAAAPTTSAGPSEPEPESAVAPASITRQSMLRRRRSRRSTARPPPVQPREPKNKYSDDVLEEHLRIRRESTADKLTKLMEKFDAMQEMEDEETEVTDQLSDSSIEDKTRKQ